MGERAGVRGFRRSIGSTPLTPTLSPSKSDISDFGQSIVRTRVNPSSSGRGSAHQQAAAASPISRNNPASLFLLRIDQRGNLLDDVLRSLGEVRDQAGHVFARDRIDLVALLLGVGEKCLVLEH